MQNSGYICIVGCLKNQTCNLYINGRPVKVSFNFSYTDNTFQVTVRLNIENRSSKNFPISIGLYSLRIYI